MNADRLSCRLVTAFIFFLLGTLSACAPSATPTFYIAPSGLTHSVTPLTTFQPVASASANFFTDTPIPGEIEAASPVPPCTDNLTWLSDLTYEDNTVVLPGQTMDKQWSVQNSGTCDWDANYHLHNINSDPMGASAEMMLFPARAGSQVTLRIIFTAPTYAGTYRSEWQAVNPNGELFGDTLYIQIIVSQ